MWDSWFSYETLSEGTATHVFAAFDPPVKGTSNIRLILETFIAH